MSPLQSSWPDSWVSPCAPSCARNSFNGLLLTLLSLWLAKIVRPSPEAEARERERQAEQMQAKKNDEPRDQRVPRARPLRRRLLEAIGRRPSRCPVARVEVRRHPGLRTQRLYVLVAPRRAGDAAGKRGGIFWHSSTSPVDAMSDEVLNSGQCAELLHCTPEQIEELARAGELPALKIGRGWVFVRADLLAYLAERAREEAAALRSKRSVGSIAPQPAPSRRRSPPTLPIILARP